MTTVMQNILQYGKQKLLYVHNIHMVHNCDNNYPLFFFLRRKKKDTRLCEMARNRSSSNIKVKRRPPHFLFIIFHGFAYFSIR